jgi:hypothetical protein
MSFLAAIIVSTLLGYLAASQFWPRGLSRTSLWVFSVPIGAGISSIIFFLFRRPMFTVEFALLFLLAAAWVVRRTPRPSHSPVPHQLPIVCLFFAGAVGFVTAGLLFAIHENPHGDWDAFAIWNSHARYLYRDGPAWQEHIHNSFHPDYPLLVPVLNARAWRYIGAEVPQTGGWLGLVFTLSGLGVLVATGTELRNLRLALLIGLVLLGTPFYLEYGVSQSADIPLSVYVLGAIALLCIYFERHSTERGLLGVAGFMAGCAGWTKNEGLLFIAAVSLALLLPVIAEPRATMQRFAAFAAGLALPLAVTLFFKTAVAPPSDLLSNREYGELISKIFSTERHGMIVSSLGRTLWSFGEWSVNPLIPLLLFVGISGINRAALRDWGWRTGSAALTLLLAGYYAVYLIAPLDLQWLLNGSSPRLFLHLWPSFLLLAGLLAVQYPHAR